MNNISATRRRINAWWSKDFEPQPGVVVEHEFLSPKYSVRVYDWKKYMSTPDAQRQLIALKQLKETTML